MQTGGGGWGNEQLQCYTDSSQNVRLDGASHLAVVARRAGPRSRADRHGGCMYTSGRLTTKDRVALCYGLVQARIRLPRGRGIWPAFWMLGHDIDDVGWPRCGEIDVMENPVQRGAGHCTGVIATCASTAIVEVNVRARQNPPPAAGTFARITDWHLGPTRTVKPAIMLR